MLAVTGMQLATLGIWAMKVRHITILEAPVAVAAIHADGTHVGVCRVYWIVTLKWDGSGIWVVNWTVRVWNWRVGSDIAHWNV